MPILIIIPAYNEAPVIGETLKSIRRYCRDAKHTGVDLLVVDDGSRDQTKQIASQYADFVVTHRQNCGLGASLGTGIEFARRKHYDACITFDADGQHDPKDIGKALKQLDKGYDVVIGSRFRGTVSGLTRTRRLILLLGDLVTWILFGIWTTDSQSGFRGLGKRAINTLRLKSNRMEVSSEFFGEIKRLGLRFTEIPIHIRYTKYSLAKGQQNHQAGGVLVKLLYILSR